MSDAWSGNVTIAALRCALGDIVEAPDRSLAPFSEYSIDSEMDVRQFRFRRIDDSEQALYEQLIESTFSTVGIFSENFLQRNGSFRYGVFSEADGLLGACSLRPASLERRETKLIGEYLPRLPGLVWEVNNVAVLPGARGGVISALLLFAAALTAHRSNVDVLFGIIRSQAIPPLVHFGLVPTVHEPYHVLGRAELCDFVCYYDTSGSRSVEYMWERGARFFHSHIVLNQIKLVARRSRSELQLNGSTDVQ